MSQGPIELSEILLRFDESKIVDLTELLSRENPAPLSFQGVALQIENRAGTVREGKDPQGKPWRKLMKHDYGFVQRILGLDRQWLDCFVGSDKLSPFVYVIRVTEKNLKGDLLADESQDRVMLGFPSEAEALAALKANYDETLVIERVTPYYIWQFKEWLGMHGLSDVRLSDGEAKPIAVDFDGVMAWRQKTHHEQKAGARIDKGFELVSELRSRGYAPYILTARTDLEFVEDWLRVEGLEIEVGNRKKPGTLVVIDDRAVDFENQPLGEILKSIANKIQLQEEAGHWVTVKSQHIFIREGQVGIATRDRLLAKVKPSEARMKCEHALRYLDEQDIPPNAIMEVQSFGSVHGIAGRVEAYAVVKGNRVILNERYLHGQSTEFLACTMKHEFTHIRFPKMARAMGEQIAFSREAAFADRWSKTAHSIATRSAFGAAANDARGQAIKYGRLR
jgi:hypothetical protein